MWALLLLSVFFPLWTSSLWPVFFLSGSCLFLTYVYAPKSVAESAPFSMFPPAKIAYYSCSQLLASVNFCPNTTGFSCYCKDANAFATMAYCFHAGHAEHVSGFLGLCNAEANVSLGMDDFTRALEYYFQNATESVIYRGSTIDTEVDSIETEVDSIQTEIIPIQKNSIVPIQTLTSITTPHTPISYTTGPVRLSDDMIALFRDSYDQFLGNYNRSITYGWYLVLFWGAVFAAAAVGNWAKVLVPKVLSIMTGPWTRMWRSKVSLPALKGRRKTYETPFLGVLDFLAPTRAECLILVAFSVLTLVLCCRGIRFVAGGPFFNTKAQAFMRYYAVRSGTLASYLLPLSVLFAGRNNILQALTRWDYSVFVMLHRWISRWMVLLLVVHSIGYSRHLLKVKAIEDYVWFGVLGTVSGLVILVQGLLVLRRTWYEAFLAFHILLAGAFMVGAWLHVKDLRFLAFYYFSVCLWVTDRLFRLQRLCRFGFPMAKVQLFEDDTLKVSVPIPRGFRAEGGGHCFVHFLQWSCFWQSHPFTYTVFNHHIIFYVKVKEGVTRRLSSYLYSNPNKVAEIRVAVEGSYGEATAAHRYDSSIFVAGGNGIPGIYAEAIEVIERDGVERFGDERFGVERFGVERFGVERFGVERFGVERFGVERFGVERFGDERFGVERFGVERFGVERFGVERFGVEGVEGAGVEVERFEVEGVESLKSLAKNHFYIPRNLENSHPKVKLIWVVREYSAVLWFFDELCQLAVLPIEVDIYVTKPSQSALRECSDKSHLLENTFSHKNYLSLDKPEKSLQNKLPHVTFHTGRPNLGKIVAAEVEQSAGSTCFVTCGHPIMVDDLRAEVVDVVAKTTKRVDYFEQLQVWA